MHFGMTYKKSNMHCLQTQKSDEGIKLEFSIDYQAAILSGSELFLTRCRRATDYVHVCVIAALYMHKQLHKIIFC